MRKKKNNRSPLFLDIINRHRRTLQSASDCIKKVSAMLPFEESELMTMLNQSDLLIAKVKYELSKKYETKVGRELSPELDPIAGKSPGGL